MLSELSRFLEQLTPPDGHYLLVWGIPSKRSTWYHALTAADLATIQTWGEREDVYVGCGYSRHDYGPTLRCPAAEISGIPGVWLDIDYGGGHKKPNLPPTEEDAYALLNEMGLAPSVVIHSGRGLQAWWLFREPWVFDTPEERASAERLTKGWSTTLRAKARGHGWDADQVGDLARVMRLPGLWNRKKVPVPTRLVSFSEARYNPEEFETFLLADRTETERAPDLTWTFSLSPIAEPPADKFVVLLENDPTFRRSWQHQRLDVSDQSASSYDAMLAIRALRAGWTGQEVVNLLIAHRRKYGADLKLREDYYRRTLNFGTKGMHEAVREDVVTQIKSGGEIPAAVASDPAELFAVTSALLGITITRLRRYCGETNTYEAEINGKRVNLGQIETLTSQAKFRNKILDALDVLPERHKKWDELIQRLFEVIENIDTGPDSTDQGAMESLVLGYLASSPPGDGRWQEYAQSDRPFIDQGAVWITTPGFKRHLTFACGERLSTRDIGTRLVKMGCVPERRSYRTEKGPTKKSCWKLPSWVRQQ